MSGIELAKTIRRDFPDLPVVLTSGYSHVLAQEGRHGFELVQKPYATGDVARVLSRLARAEPLRGGIPFTTCRQVRGEVAQQSRT